MLNAKDSESLLQLLNKVFTGEIGDNLTVWPKISTEGAYYGYTYAIRRCVYSATTCQACKDADREIIPAILVLSGNADREHGKCVFRFC